MYLLVVIAVDFFFKILCTLKISVLIHTIDLFNIFESKYGYLRPNIEKVIYQFLDCGILHNGFVRVKC